MKIALITDTHFGGKNDNLSFSTFQRRFYEGTFFPILDREGVSTVLHLGDTFDRRKYTNFLSLKLAKEMFFDPIRDRGLDFHVLLGNHDCYYKTTNEVNSMSLTCSEYNFHRDGTGCHMSKYNNPTNAFMHDHVRKISMTVLLNKSFEGGDFEFTSYSKEKCEVTPVEMNQGDIIVFPSFMEHRVAPITKGIRYSLVTWFVGPPFK